MRAIRAFLFRLTNLLDKGRKERELAEELESHLGMQIEDNLRAGMSPEQARREALLKSGGLETSKERCRDRRGLPLVETVLRDFAYAMRQVRGTPGFTAVAVITLALGLTVNATIFFMINDLFLRPLPAADPGKLVMIAQKIPQSEMMSSFRIRIFWTFGALPRATATKFQRWRRLSGVMAYLESAVQMSRQGEAAERTYVHVVSGNYFTVLGAQPMMGRLFLPNEGRTSGADAIIVLTYDCWHSRFAADPHIVGQTVKINGLPFTVVGVTQPKFVGAEWGTALSGFVPISMLPLMNPGGNKSSPIAATHRSS